MGTINIVRRYEERSSFQPWYHGTQNILCGITRPTLGYIKEVNSGKNHCKKVVGFARTLQREEAIWNWCRKVV